MSHGTSTPPSSSTPLRNSISLFLERTALRTSSQELFSQCFSIAPLVHRRVGRSHRPKKEYLQVGLVHVAVGDPSAGGLGWRLPVQGVLSPPPEVFQIDLPHIGEELGRLGVAPPPTRLDLEEMVVRQVRPSGELLLAELPAQSPVLEAGERKPPPLSAGSTSPRALSLSGLWEPSATRRISSRVEGSVSHPPVGHSMNHYSPARPCRPPLRRSRAGKLLETHPDVGKRRDKTPEKPLSNSGSLIGVGPSHYAVFAQRVLTHDGSAPAQPGHPEIAPL